MNSTCLIGNSHAAGLYRVLVDSCVSDLDIFARGGQDLHMLQCKEGKLSIPEPGQSLFSNTDRNYIDMSQYKHIIIYGCQVLTSKRSVDWFFDYNDAASGNYSSGCIQSLFLGSLFNSLSLKIVNLIQSEGYNGTITIVPSPLPNELHPRALLNNGEQEPTVLRGVEALYRNTLLKKNINYKSLPEILLADNNYTVSKKFISALDSEENKEDYSHLNELGCLTVMKSLFVD
jgi:hypothetical protein